MPTVLRIDGSRMVIFPNDHPPAHVHVLRPGWVGVVNLITPELREAIGFNERESRRVLRLVADQRYTLIDTKRRYHD